VVEGIMPRKIAKEQGEINILCLRSIQHPKKSSRYLEPQKHVRRRKESQ